MRRADKEITDRNLIDSIIHKAPVCRIALYDGAMPYIVPLSFGYDGRHIYFHSAQEGRKIDILRRNPRLCFQLESDCAVLPAEKACSFTMQYRSVIGYGTACFLEDVEEKNAAVRVIMSQYTDKTFTFTENDLVKITVIRVDVEQITAKESGFKRGV